MTHRGVYLQTLAKDRLTVHYSVGAQRRAAQLAGFLSLLESQLSPLGEVRGAALLVLTKADWRQLYSGTYGLAQLRTKKGGVAELLVPVAYPEKFLHQFDDVLLKAGRAGVRAPGEPAEFLDLLAAQAWFLSVLKGSGLGTRLGWLNEVVASYLLMLALDAAGLIDLAQRYQKWAQLELAGGEPSPFTTLSRGRLGFARARWVHGAVVTQAAALAAAGWRFGLEWQALNKPFASAELLQVLVDLEPSFELWLDSVAVLADDTKTKETK